MLITLIVGVVVYFGISYLKGEMDDSDDQEYLFYKDFEDKDD